MRLSSLVALASRSFRGSWAFLAFGILVAYHLHLLAVQEHGVPQNGPVARHIRVTAGRGRDIAQVFRMEANGLSALTLYLEGNDTLPDQEVVVHVWELAPWYPKAPDERRLLTRQSFAGGNLRASSEFTLSFEPVERSRDRSYRVEVSMPSAPDETGIGFIANTEGGHPGGALWIGDREQWADLAFTTRALQATALASAADALGARMSRTTAAWLIGLVVVAGDAALVCLVAALVVAGSRLRREQLSSPSHRADRIWLVPALSWRAVVLVVAAAASAIALWRSGVGVDAVEADAIDLLARFAEADKRTTFGTLHEAFDIQDVTIDGIRRSSLLALPFSRVTWTVDVPPKAVLRTAVAFRPDTWTREGDGAMFRIGVSDGTRYEELYRRYLAPHASPGDRRWYQVETDLSAFEGSRVDLILNTEPGELGNGVADATVWGLPRIVPGASRRARAQSPDPQP